MSFFTMLEIYLAVINLVAFAAFGLDKGKAVARAWRISETTLLLLAAAGGSVGAYLGMRVFHHKTKHLKFRFGVPVLFLFQLALAVYVWEKL